jgi:heme/copper-type cytochrome/quinol oxidase subunit 4
MTYEEVNKSFENTIKHHISGDTFILFALIIIMPLITVSFVVARFIIGENAAGIIVLLLSIILVIATFSLFNYKCNNEEEGLREWKKNVQTNYLDKLPIEKVEILEYVGVGKRLSGDQMEIEFTYLYKTINTKTILMTTIKSVDGLEKPYLEFKYVENKIPQDYMFPKLVKEYYNPVLYVPTPKES